MGEVAKIWFGGQTRKANNSIIIHIAVQQGRPDLHLPERKLHTPKLMQHNVIRKGHFF